MPTIRPYQQQVSPEVGLPGRNAQASDLGHTGFSQLGNAVQSATQDAAQATAIIERNRGRQQATDADLNATLASVTLTEKLQAREKNWKPGDLPLIGDAAAEIQQTLDGLKYNEDGSEKYDTEDGRTTLAQRTSHLAAQYLLEAGRAQSRLDGVAAEESFKTWTSAKGNFLAQGVNYLHIESSLKELEQTLHTGIYTGISEGARAGLFRMGKGFLAENAMEGMIRDNPKGAITALQGGFMADALGEGKTSSLLEKARVMDHLMTQHAKTAQDEFKEAQKNAALSQYSQAVQVHLEHRADPTKPGITPAYLNSLTNLMSHLPQDALQLQGLVDRDMKEAKEGATKGNPLVYRQLFGKLRAGELGTIKEIDKARVDGDLTAEWHGELVSEYNKSLTPEGRDLIKASEEFFKRAEMAIVPKDLPAMLADPEAGFRMLQYQHDVRTAMEQDRKDGKDPMRRITPGNPEYMGTHEHVQQYVTPFMQRIHEGAKRLQAKPNSPKTPEAALDALGKEVQAGAPAAAPSSEPPRRKPGESQDAFLKRVNP